MSPAHMPRASGGHVMASEPSDLLQLRTDQVSWREVDGEVIVLDLRSSSYFAVNESAVPLWRALANGTTRADMVRDLVDTFGIDEQQAAADVDAFVESCRASGLLSP